MDFDSAIQAHQDWKAKLATYIRTKDGSLDENTVTKDNVCPLGQWLHGEGNAKYGSDSEFKELVAKHADFHKAAADIVRRVNAGETVNEGSTLDMTSPYGVVSKEVIQLIIREKLKAARA